MLSIDDSLSYYLYFWSLIRFIVPHTYKYTEYTASLHVCKSVYVWKCVSQRHRGLSSGHWPCAYQFAVISLAWLSSICCQLSKGLLWAYPLMRGCSYALESIQCSNRSRMAAQGLPIALDWRMSKGRKGQKEMEDTLKKDRYVSHSYISIYIYMDRYILYILPFFLLFLSFLLLTASNEKSSNWHATNLQISIWRLLTPLFHWTQNKQSLFFFFSL